MPAGTDLIFFDNSADWETIANTNRTAQTFGEDSYIPIPAFDLGVTLDSEYIAVVAGTTQGKPSWQFAGDIRQVYDFAPGGSNPITGKVQSPPNRLFINKLQIVETTRISPDSFRLRYSPPFWFRDCTIRVYKYTGDALNFVEDTLFDIGNALGVDPNQDESLIGSQLQVIEELISDKFLELRNSHEAEIQLDNQREAELLAQINQLDATNSAGKLEEISGELEEQAELLKQKDMAYEELLQAYESYRTEQEGGEELEGAIKAIKELPKVDNLEELQLKIQETENDLIEVTNE